MHSAVNTVSVKPSKRVVRTGYNYIYYINLRRKSSMKSNKNIKWYERARDRSFGSRLRLSVSVTEEKLLPACDSEKLLTLVV